MIKRKIEYWKDILERRNEALNATKGRQVRLYNWCRVWTFDHWLIDFIEKRGLLKDRPKMRIGLYSIFAPMWLSYLDRNDIRIFVARENLHKKSMQGWEHQFINDNRIALSLGFDHIDHVQKYMRMPFWLMWSVFKPTDNYDDVKRRVEGMNAPANSSYSNRNFCAFLCSHDDIGRKQIYTQLNSLGKVDCDGQLFHNNNTLKSIYGDNKLDYLRQYRFNLTPENSNYDGYCTEKIFEAIHAGCIPIYNGSNNNPEPEVLNQDAIVFIEMGQENRDSLSLVKTLNENEKAYLDFAQQPRFIPGAAERIWEYYVELENKIREIIK